MTTVATPVRTEQGLAVDSVNRSVLLALIVLLSMLLPSSPVTQATAIAGLILFVGTWTTSQLRMDGTSLSQRIAMAAGTGVLVVLTVSAVLGSVLPHLGVAHPLSRGPSLIAWCVILLGLGAIDLARGDDHVADCLHGLRLAHVGWCAALAVPPVLALIGVSRLNATGSTSLAIGTAVLAVAMVCLAVGLPRLAAGPPRILLLLSAMVTATWQITMRGGWMSGLDIQHEYFIGKLTESQGAFPLAHYVDPYGGMLSLTVWPAELHALTGINLRTSLVLIPSLFLAGCLLAAWAMVRERAGERTAAVLCGLFILGSVPLIQELPQITRQCSALFFFTLLVMAVASTHLSARSARLLAVVGGLGVAVTHYSTAYLSAGAVLVGCAMSLAFQRERTLRVLTLPVTAVIVGVTVLWEGVVAKTGASLGQIWTNIRTEGLQVFPGSGNLLTHWLNGAAVSQLVNARVLHASDLHLRVTRYHWMRVQPSAAHVAIVNLPSPTARGTAVIGPLLSIASTLLAETLLVASILAVGICLWQCRRNAQIAGLTGMAVFFLLVSGLARFSRTIGIEFGPSRVQAQAYILFIALIAVALQTEWPARTSRWIRARKAREASCVAAGVVIVGLALATSMQLTNLVEHKAQLPAQYSAVGEAVQRLMTPPDILAATWISLERPEAGLVQSDRFGQLPLLLFGYSNRRNYFSTIDPVIVDNRSWVFANRTNVIVGTARGGDTTGVGVFRFPTSYFAATRSILYVSPTDVVFGQVPLRYRAHQPAGHAP